MADILVGLCHLGNWQIRDNTLEGRSVVISISKGLGLGTRIISSGEVGRMGGPGDWVGDCLVMQLLDVALSEELEASFHGLLEGGWFQRGWWTEEEGVQV